MTARLRAADPADLPGLRARDDVPMDFYDDPGADLDQAWDVLTRVLSAADPLAGTAIVGGAPFGTDQGSGRPRTFTAAQVAAVAGALERIGEGDVARMHARTDLTGCYAAGSSLEQVIDRFVELRDCYRAAAGRGQAMVLFM